MRKILRELPIRRIIVTSILLGCMLGSVSVFADDPEIELTCPGGRDQNGNTCTFTGCHNSQPNGTGYQVCLFNESGCPPLTQCT